MSSQRERDRELRNLRAEVYRLGERTENQTTYIELLEKHLHELLVLSMPAGLTVTIADAIGPLRGGVNLLPSAEDNQDPPYLRPPRSVPRSEQAPTEDSWWPRESSAHRPIVPTAGWRNYTLHKRMHKVVGVSVCGLSPATLASVIAAIAVQQAGLEEFIPVFITDSKEFDAFRRYGYLWEYLPGPDDRARYVGTLNWVDYVAQRRALIARKWGFSRTIYVGAAEFASI